MDSIIEGFNALLAFFDHGLYDFADSLLVQLGSWYVIWSFQMQLIAINFAWDVAKAVIENIGLSDLINQAWGNIDSSIMGYLVQFRIVDGLNVLLNAYVTRYVLSLF